MGSKARFEIAFRGKPFREMQADWQGGRGGLPYMGD
jgi:hypothetical protein